MDHAYEISNCNKKYIDAYYALSQSSVHRVVLPISVDLGHYQSTGDLHLRLAD